MPTGDKYPDDRDYDPYAASRPTPPLYQSPYRRQVKVAPETAWALPAGDCYMCGKPGETVNSYDEGRFTLSFCSGCCRELSEGNL